MFDFGFRPWTEVIGDVGNQVKEQINRYQENRLREQLLQREDNLRQQGIAREDQIDARDWDRKLGLIGDERAYREQQANMPVDSDLSSFVRELMSGGNGKVQSVPGGGSETSPSEFYGPSGSVMGLGIRGYEPEEQDQPKAVQVDVPAQMQPRGMSQREYDNAMQAAPFFKAIHGANGGRRTLEEELAIIAARVGGQKEVAGIVQGALNNRNDKTIGSRYGLQGRDQEFKANENEKNRRNRLEVEALRQKTRMELAEYNKNFAGLSDREKNLVSELNKLEDQLTQLTSRDVAVVKGEDWRKQVEETKAKIDATMKELKSFRAGNAPAPKKASTSGKKTTTTQPQTPPPPTSGKKVSFSAKDKAGQVVNQTLDWTPELEARLKQGGFKYEIK